MCLLLESIRIIDGKPIRLGFHRDRMNRSRAELFGCDDILDPVDLITVPGEMSKGLVKCRIKYKQGIESIEFAKYIAKKITALRLVMDDSIDYNHKYADRSSLEKLLAKKGECDDILIVKQGLITDTSSGNIVFKSDEGFFTPAKPLLKGTQRQFLLQQGTIQERDLRPEDIKGYSVFYIINAMRELEGNETGTDKILGA